MAKIEYYATRKETLDLPKCFCGAEPKLREEPDYSYPWVVIECPYCHAHANEGRGWNTFHPYQKAVEEAAEDWIKMIERRKANGKSI